MSYTADMAPVGKHVLEMLAGTPMPLSLLVRDFRHPPNTRRTLTFSFHSNFLEWLGHGERHSVSAFLE
jgi:hypothetical protein